MRIGIKAVKTVGKKNKQDKQNVKTKKMFINNLHLTLCIDLSSYDVIFVINTWIISSEKEQTLKIIKKKRVSMG
jgi:hypothetical protein